MVTNSPCSTSRFAPDRAVTVPRWELKVTDVSRAETAGGLLGARCARRGGMVLVLRGGDPCLSAPSDEGVFEAVQPAGVKPVSTYVSWAPPGSIIPASASTSMVVAQSS